MFFSVAVWHVLIVLVSMVLLGLLKLHHGFDNVNDNKDNNNNNDKKHTGDNNNE